MPLCYIEQENITIAWEWKLICLGIMYLTLSIGTEINCDKGQLNSNFQLELLYWLVSFTEYLWTNRLMHRLFFNKNSSNDVGLQSFNLKLSYWWIIQREFIIDVFRHILLQLFGTIGINGDRSGVRSK